MEEQYKKEEIIIKKLISEAGLDTPSPDFRTSLMQRIEQSTSKKIQYTPLISTKTWWILGMLVICGITLIYMIPFENSASRFTLPIDDLGSFIPEIKISKTFLYATIFLGLFLFQIPLLKKYSEGKYR